MTARNAKHDAHIYKTISELADFTGYAPSELLEIFNAQGADAQRSLAGQVHGDTPQQFRAEVKQADKDGVKPADSDGDSEGDDVERELESILGGMANSKAKVA